MVAKALETSAISHVTAAVQTQFWHLWTTVTVVVRYLKTMQQLQAKVPTMFLLSTLRGSKANTITSKVFCNVIHVEYNIEKKNKFSEKELQKFIQFLSSLNSCHFFMRKVERPIL